MKEFLFQDGFHAVTTFPPKNSIVFSMPRFSRWESCRNRCYSHQCRNRVHGVFHFGGWFCDGVMVFAAGRAVSMLYIRQSVSLVLTLILADASAVKRLIERQLTWAIINSWPTQQTEKSYELTIDDQFHGYLLHGSQLLVYSVPSRGEHVEFKTMKLYDLDRIDARTELVLDEVRFSFPTKPQGEIQGERFFYFDPDAPTRGLTAFILEFPKRNYYRLQEAVGFSNTIKRRIAEIAAGEFSVNT